MVDLATQPYGPPDGPLVLVLHGLGAGARDWAEVATALADPYRVVAVDQRGHGASPWQGPYSVATLVDDVADLTAAYAPRPYVLVGHSLGGTVAQVFAARRPDGLRGLVVVDSPLPRTRTAPIAYEPPPDPGFDVALAAPLLGEIADPDPGWFAGLDRIAVPTLVLAGGPTSHVPQDEVAASAARIPDARLVEIAGGGHSIHRNRPDDLVREVTAFLATTSPTP